MAPFCRSSDVSTYGPEPTGLVANSAPRCSTAFFDTMQPEPSAITTSNRFARACDSTMRPSYLLFTSTPVRCSQSALYAASLAPSLGGRPMRSNENLTSSAVISPKPSENIWPGFNLNSMTVGEICLISAAASSSSSVELGFCRIRR